MSSGHVLSSMLCPDVERTLFLTKPYCYVIDLSEKSIYEVGLRKQYSRGDGCKTKACREVEPGGVSRLHPANHVVTYLLSYC